MFKRILIANRGEIALRILRCCSEMNIETVVVYSEADEDSLPVMLATHSVCIGPARAAESYLNEDVIVETAVKLGCDAIHPGYGFLSENAGFARKCRERGIIFIGPAAEIIAKMGDKQAARELMQKSGGACRSRLKGAGKFLRRSSRGGAGGWLSGADQGGIWRRRKGNAQSV